MTENVIIDGFTFFVTDDEYRTDGPGGLFHRDTRYLSELSVSLAGASLAPVGSHLDAPWRRVVRYADVSSAINKIDGSEEQKHTALSLTRDRVVAEDTGLVERLTVSNHSPDERTVSLSLDVDADFKDIFEVRKLWTDLDRHVERSVDDGRLRYRYDGGDRRTDGAALTVGFDPEPDVLAPAAATFDRSLAPQTSTDVTLAAIPEAAAVTVDQSLPDRALAEAGGSAFAVGPAERLGDSRYATLIERAGRDLRALVTETEYGPVPLAGVPWFATVFGRDALLTAYNVVHLAPELAEGTLRYLAARQGTDEDAARDEQPGKIFHELRQGELAERGDIPHTPYYGTVDATPLWLVLLDETRRWTDDDALVDSLWDSARAAAEWLTAAVDRTGDDPFLYYDVDDEDAVSHKAWRDTERSVQFADGEAAEAPLASVEVQGYAYDAFGRVASMARERGDDAAASEYEARAGAIRERFDEEFWVADRAYYGAAKTADGRIVDSATSNVGQCLWSGIVPEERAAAVVQTLLGDGLDSGWGIRTMSRRDAGYSPVSYHVGSVWPHDNALIALGTNAYGFRRATETIATGVLDACRSFDGERVPELYCGFGDDFPPHSYPAACKPQAWSASTPFALLRALFDVRPGTGANPTLGTVPETVDVDPLRAVALCASNQDDRTGGE